MRLLMCGGRDYTDAATVSRAFDVLKPSVVIHGDARGADTLADEEAKRRGIDRIRFPANWKRDKKAAGPIRNQRMIDEGKPDAVCAFPGGNGTADMIRRAKAAGLKVYRPVNSP